MKIAQPSEDSGRFKIAHPGRKSKIAQPRAGVEDSTAQDGASGRLKIARPRAEIEDSMFQNV